MNPEVSMSLDDCVDEVLGFLTGTDLSYDSSFDRYRTTARQINRALRLNALEKEWSYYTSTEDVGRARAGVRQVPLRNSVRPRILGDDAVRLATDGGMPVVWAYFLPRDAVDKYPMRRGLRVAVSGNTLTFSRPFSSQEDGLRILLPVMREPRMFKLPPHPRDTGQGHEEPLPEVPVEVREQLLDFEYPDLVLMRAAVLIAQSDPMMQPRVQALEEQYKELFYALNERDDRHTDHPFMNEFNLPIQSDLNGSNYQDYHHPHSDERY